MDRLILEGDPHAVLEAMAIGSCMSATKGFIYVQAEYPVAVKRLKIAIAQAKEMGLLGDNSFPELTSVLISISDLAQEHSFVEKKQRSHFHRRQTRHVKK